MRQFSAESIDWLRSEAAGGASRSGLALGLCEREGWFNDAGRPCEVSARLALPEIAGRCGVALPPAGSPPPRGGPLPEFPDVRHEGGLASLGGVSLEPAAGGKESRRFRAMMASHHPRGSPDHPGARLLYWIRCPLLGSIGGLSFHAANWHQKARDDFIGWSPKARMANLRLLVNNSRFLILPGVRVKNLASRVLALAAGRLGDDWLELHGVRPAMAYSFTGPEHAGVCYAAAGWRLAGSSSGKPPARRGGAAACGVWMRPLEDGWRERLRREPPEPLWLGPAPALGPGADWAELEFGFSSHADGRLRKRIPAMARVWEKRPGEPVSAVFPETAAQKAAYRLLSNPKVAMDDILESHRAATVQRCRDETTVLAVQAATMLDFSGLKGSTGGLAPLGGGGSGSVGVPAHATLAVSASGRGLGVLGIDADFRSGITRKADRRRAKDGAAPPEAPPEAEGADGERLCESVRWLESFALAQRVGRSSPGTRVVSVCDREGDMWSLFEAQAEDPEAAGLLVRSCASTSRSVVAGGKVADLREHMAGLPAVGRRGVRIAARGGMNGSRGRKAKKPRPARTAETELRAAMVELKAPGRSRRTLPLLAVLASETTTPPGGEEPLNWLLLSSDGTPDPEGAVEILRRYEARWTIEEFFKTLKQATRIEDRRLDEADDLRRCLAFDAVLAWRVFDIQRAAKAEPDRPALDFFDEDELTALYIGMEDYGFKNARAPPFDGYTIREAAVDVGRYAGFIPSRRQSLPGTEKSRAGMKFLLYAAATYKAIKKRGMIVDSTVA